MFSGAAMLKERNIVPALNKSWPTFPYKGLNYYTAADSPLFAQREFEIASCAEIAGNYETKMLLLHGRSGTGKSSFLRAGLLPRLLGHTQHFTALQTIGQPEEPYLIRCTDDPISRMRSALLVAIKEDQTFSLLPEKEKLTAKSILEDANNNGSAWTSLLDGLQIITSCLTGTLILAIDQCEEVLTLSSEERSSEKKTAFFSFLEEICFRRIDLKLIVCLRTEYYGQFCDRFRIGPSLSITTKKVGMEQFMLHGMQDESDLVAAIIRPTLRLNVGNFSPPHDKYQFEYAPGLAEAIAIDIVKHCGESSALPVMQIVCNDLYTSVVLQSRRPLIVFNDYRKQGGVEGALDRFIDQSIRSAVTKVARGPTNEEVEQWRDVISTLVARQEGGALTTLLSPTDELKDAARKKGLKHCIEECLVEMADEKYRLLRKVALISPGLQSTENFSLGHDALAASLFRWKESRERLLEARRRYKHAVIICVAIMFALLSGVVLGGAQWVYMRRQAANTINAYTEREPLLDARIRLLLLLANWKQSDGIARKLLPFNETRKRLEDVLVQAPQDMLSADAFGLSKDGLHLSILRGATVLKAEVGEAQKQVVVGTVGAKDKPPKTELSNSWPSVGFVAGLDAPVAYKDGQFTIWSNGSKKVINIDELIKINDFQFMPVVEIAGGFIRITSFDRGKLHFSDLRYEPNSDLLRPQPTIDFDSPGFIWPTYSDFSDLISAIRIGNQSNSFDVLVGSRFDSSKISKLPLPLRTREKSTNSATLENTQFPHSIAFSKSRSISFCARYLKYFDSISAHQWPTRQGNFRHHI